MLPIEMTYKFLHLQNVGATIGCVAHATDGSTTNTMSQDW